MRRPQLVRLLVGLFALTVLGACDRGTPPSSRQGRAPSPSEGRTELQAPSQLAPQPSEAPPPETRDDHLTREVRGKLYSDPVLSGAGSIVVLVHGSRVLLEGWVSSVNERTLAEADAETVAGVLSVDNRLLVRPVAQSLIEAGAQ